MNGSRRPQRALTVLVVVLVLAITMGSAATALAFVPMWSISGTVTDGVATRSTTPKSTCGSCGTDGRWTKCGRDYTDTSGDYSFTVAAGTYRVGHESAP